MFHIAVWKSPDLSVIISPLSLPACLSPLISPPLTFSSSSCPPFYPPPPMYFTLPSSPWFLPSSPSSSSSSEEEEETTSETWYCLSGSIRFVAVRGPPLLHVSYQTLTSPMWESSPPLFFFTLLHSFCLSSTFQSFLVPWTCSVPSLHHWLNVTWQAYSPSNSQVCHHHPSPGIIIAGMLSYFF